MVRSPGYGWLLALLLGVWGCGGGGSESLSTLAARGTGSIVGTVSGLLGGVGVIPLAGATVTATRVQGTTLVRITTTDLNGGYLFGDLPVGVWEVRITAAGFADPLGAPPRVSVGAGGVATIPDVVLLESGTGGSALGAGLTGSLRASLLDAAYRAQGELGRVTISSPQVPFAQLQPVLDPATTAFSVQLPPSTGAGNVVLDLVFTHPFFEDAVLAGVVAPPPGSVSTVSSPVTLTPRTVALTGDVFLSTGGPALSLGDRVTLVETGETTSVVAGVYRLASVPVGIPLTLRATASGPGGPEFAQAVVTVLGSGTVLGPTLFTSP